MDAHWYIDLYQAVKPNQMRYWGHTCSNAAYGQEEDGSKYTGRDDGDHDAILPMQFDRKRLQSYVTHEEGLATISPWNPWRYDGGFYWQMFNKEGADSSNLVGIFAAKAGRAVEVGYNGPGFWLHPPLKLTNSPRAKLQPLCGIGSNNFRAMADASVFRVPDSLGACSSVPKLT